MEFSSELKPLPIGAYEEAVATREVARRDRARLQKLFKREGVRRY